VTQTDKRLQIEPFCVGVVRQTQKLKEMKKLFNLCEYANLPRRA